MLDLTALRWLLLLSLLSGCANRHAAPEPAPTCPEPGGSSSASSSAPGAAVLVLSTYHMSNPGADYVNIEAGDVKEQARQQQLDAVVERLAAFAPTMIAVEWDARDQPGLDSAYARYGALAPEAVPRDEIHQLAFRLAARLGAERVYAVDWLEPDLELNIGGTLARADSLGMSQPAAEVATRLEALGADTERTMQTESVGGILRWLNTESFDDRVTRSYSGLAAIGSAEEPLGAEVVGTWYRRNLQIVANIARLSRSPDDRILVLFGAGHGAILRELIDNSSMLHGVAPAEYLSADQTP